MGSGRMWGRGVGFGGGYGVWGGVGWECGVWGNMRGKGRGGMGWG